jgi:hypothetical protein
MGCDIHLHVEQRDVDGIWSPVADSFDSRNYRLFSALAGVRNGTGFAGCDMGDPIEPIAAPRGLPAGVSAAVQAESDEWDIDGHSHSWLTVGELLAHDWDQTVVARGLVRDAVPGDRRFENGGKAAWVIDYFETFHSWPPDTEICSMTTASGYVPIEWRMPLSGHLDTDWFAFVLRLGRLAAGDPTSVRIVFWFDN